MLSRWTLFRCPPAADPCTPIRSAQTLVHHGRGSIVIFATCQFGCAACLLARHAAHFLDFCRRTGRRRHVQQGFCRSGCLPPARTGRWRMLGDPPAGCARRTALRRSSARPPARGVSCSPAQCPCRLDGRHRRRSRPCRQPPLPRCPRAALRSTAGDQAVHADQNLNNQTSASLIFSAFAASSSIAQMTIFSGCRAHCSSNKLCAGWSSVNDFGVDRKDRISTVCVPIQTR